MKKNNIAKSKYLNVLIASSLLIMQSNIVFADVASVAENSVPSGTAVFDRSQANTLNITTSNKVIINYDSFSIGTPDTVNFYQPNANSVALNRVISTSPSYLNGKMNSNGKIFVVNPNGIVFGKTFQGDMGGLVASSLDIRNTDFLKERYKFYQRPGFGTSAVVNRGNIVTPNGGYVMLLGNAVNNTGTIVANAGTVVLAGGERMTVDLDDLSDISVDISGGVNKSVNVYNADAQVEKSAVSNSGMIIADGGKVILNAKVLKSVFEHAINNTGEIHATRLVNKGGKVELVSDSGNLDVQTGMIRGDKEITVDSSGSVNAQDLLIAVNDGSTGINVVSRGNVNVGYVDAGKGVAGIKAGKSIVDNYSKVHGNIVYLNGKEGVGDLNRINTEANGLVAKSQNGAVKVSQKGAVNLLDVSAKGDIAIEAQGGDIYVTQVKTLPGGANDTVIELHAQTGNVHVGQVDAGNGSGAVIMAEKEIIDDGSSIKANGVYLRSKEGIGNTKAIATETKSVYAFADKGNVQLDQHGDVSLDSVTAKNGHVVVLSDGDIDVNAVKSVAGEGVSLITTDGDINIKGSVEAANNVELSAYAGSINGVGAGQHVVAKNTTLVADYNIGSEADLLNTKTDNLSADVGYKGDMFIGQTGEVTLDNVTNHNGSIFVLSNGTINANNVRSFNGEPGDHGVALLAVQGDVNIKGAVQSDKGLVALGAPNGSIHASGNQTHVVAKEGAVISAAGTIGVDNPVNVNIDNDLLVEMFGVEGTTSGRFAGTVNGQVATIPVVSPAVLTPSQNPPGDVFFNNIKIWPTSGSVSSASSLDAARFTRPNTEFLYPNAQQLPTVQVNTFDAISSASHAGPVFLYHPLAEVDSSASDASFQLDEGAYDFIDGRIEEKKKQKINIE